LDVDLFRPDVFFDCGRTFIIMDREAMTTTTIREEMTTSTTSRLCPPRPHNNKPFRQGEGGPFGRGEGGERLLWM
jgi:hypothetical protein